LSEKPTPRNETKQEETVSAEEEPPEDDGEKKMKQYEQIDVLGRGK